MCVYMFVHERLDVCARMCARVCALLRVRARACARGAAHVYVYIVHMDVRVCRAYGYAYWCAC